MTSESLYIVADPLLIAESFLANSTDPAGMYSDYAFQASDAYARPPVQPYTSLSSSPPPTFMAVDPPLMQLPLMQQNYSSPLYCGCYIHSGAASSSPGNYPQHAGEYRPSVGSEAHAHVSIGRRRHPARFKCDRCSKSFTRKATLDGQCVS